MKEIVLLAFVVFVAIAQIVRVITRCVLLEKAGKRWWQGIIPFVSEYQMLSIAWKKRWLPMYIVAELIRSFITAVARVFINDWTLLFGALVAPVFVYTIVLLGIVYFVFMITLCANLSLHFGRSKEFGFAMAVFPFVFGPILAFGKNEYRKEAEKWMVI